MDRVVPLVSTIAGQHPEGTFFTLRLCRRVMSANGTSGCARRLWKLPGNRLFQYVTDDGVVRRLRRRDANAFLCEITNSQISLKDFRTLSACSQALAQLSRLDPKPSQRGKRAQIKAALRE
jgi:DNA topoisomerase IB